MSGPGICQQPRNPLGPNPVSRSLLVSNVDRSQARIAGLAGDLAARFLDEFSQAAGLTLHVRLVEGRDTQHVLEAIFKALGVALAQACRPRRREGE